MIDRKRSDLELALSRHKDVLVGIDGALERSSDSLAWRIIELEESCIVIENLYGEIVLLSDVAGIRPPKKPVIARRSQ
jgi:hypothetical protein